MTKIKPIKKINLPLREKTYSNIAKYDRCNIVQKNTLYFRNGIIENDSGIFEIIKEKGGKVINRYLKILFGNSKCEIFYDKKNDILIKSASNNSGDLLFIKISGTKDKKIAPGSKIVLKNSKGENIKEPFIITNPKNAGQYYNSALETARKAFGKYFPC